MKEQVKSLWKLCFPDDSDDFVALYFSSRYTDEINSAITENGRVVSALQRIPYPMRFNGAVIPVAYISGACTHPDFRSRGLMSRLLDEAHRKMYADGKYLSVLIPANEGLVDYYSKSGYEICFQQDEKLLTGMCETVDNFKTELIFNELDLLKNECSEVCDFINRQLSTYQASILHPFQDMNIVLADLALSGGKVWYANDKNGNIRSVVLLIADESCIVIKELLSVDNQSETAMLGLISYNCTMTIQDNLDNQIVIYQTSDGQTQIDVKMQEETVWLTQDMIVKLFNSSKANISEHIKHIYEEGELDKISTVRKFRTVRQEGKRQVSRKLEYYNLDLILSVGYRVKSKIATQFRIWANKILKEYLIKGYSINEQLLLKQQQQLETLQNTISLLTRSLTNQVETVEQAQSVAKILETFAHGLNLLDNFDHKKLDRKGNTTKEAIRISKDEFLEVINAMKSDFESDVFAVPKNESFSSSVNQIYQTFDGKELYPTLEEKAAMLLYLIVKNHSFADGNKRIGASCFLYFMSKNGILYNDGIPIIDNSTLFALTLLIAESNPAEMEIIKQVVISVLNKNIE